MADDKTLSFNIVIDGVSNEATELQKLYIQFQNLNKEYKDLQKTVKQQGGIASTEQLQQLAAYSKELENNKNQTSNLKKVIDTASDSLDRMKAALIEMKATANAGSEELRNKMAPAINELAQKISTAEQAQGTWSRNVGNYANGISDGFLSMAKSMVGPTAAIALLVKAFEGIKNAIMTTTFGIDTLNNFNAAAKQGFYDFATSMQFSTAKMIEAIEVQKTFNELRTEQYGNDYNISKINRDLQAQRLLASDQTKTQTERLAALNKVEADEKEMTAIKIDHIDKEYAATLRLHNMNVGDETLIQRLLALGTERNNVLAEADAAMKRVETTRTGIMEKEIKDHEKTLQMIRDAADEQIDIDKKELKAREKILDDYYDYNKKSIANLEKLAQAEFDKGVAKEKVQDDYKSNFFKLFGIKEETLGLQHNKNIEKQQEQHSKAMLKLTEDEENAKMNIAKSVGDLINGFVGKNKALQKAGLIADKAVAVAEIIIQTQKANAAMTAWGAAFAIPTFGGSIVAAAAINAKNQIAEFISIGAVIASTVTALAGFSKGGKIRGGMPINTGTVDNRLIAVNNSETVLTAQHVAMLGGSGVMRRIGVPGYASGGFVGMQAPYIPASGNREMVDAINNRIDRLEVSVDVNRINQAQKTIQVITTTQKI